MTEKVIIITEEKRYPVLEVKDVTDRSINTFPRDSYQVYKIPELMLERWEHAEDMFNRVQKEMHAVIKSGKFKIEV